MINFLLVGLQPYVFYFYSSPFHHVYWSNIVAFIGLEFYILLYSFDKKILYKLVTVLGDKDNEEISYLYDYILIMVINRLING